MADPLSVAAGVVGLLTAAAQISLILHGILKNSKSAPTECKRIKNDVDDIKNVLTQLQAFLVGTRVAPRSRSVLIMVDQVTATLASCVTTFDALKLFVEGLQTEQSMKLLERLRWSSKVEELQSFQLKIEAHKATLTLMLSILTCQKQDDAEEKVDALRTEIDGLKALSAEILARMAMWDFTKNLPPARIHSYSLSIQNTPQDAYGNSAHRDSIDGHSEPSVIGVRKDARGFAFEELLMNSRAYRSAAHNNSDVFSVSTSAGRTATWSMLSGLSLSEMSNIAILAIPVYQSDLHDKEVYDFEPPRTDAIVVTDNHETVSHHNPSKTRLSSKLKGWLRKSGDADIIAQNISPKVFGVAIEDSIRYANVAIGLTNDKGEQYVYGYIPIIVAKTGVYMKEKGTDVHDIFAQDGHAVRVANLQSAFDQPDRYGKGLDWTGYTVHDAASLLLRYVKSLPESVVPYAHFHRFTSPMISYQASLDVKEQGAPDSDRHLATILYFQDCVKELPASSRQLLLYILDLMAVIASKEELNNMSASRLASVFNPGIISGPPAEMTEEKHQLALDTLVFLIENQDNFLIGFNESGESFVMNVGSKAPDSRDATVPLNKSKSF